MARNTDTARNALVDTAWVADHLDDPTVRVVASNEGMLRDSGATIPGAVTLDWRGDLQSRDIRDVIGGEAFEALLAARGISNDTTVVLYGNAGNRLAACVYWLFKLYGHADCRLMDGGHTRWVAEGRPLSRAAPAYSRAAYRAHPVDLSLRAFRDQVLAHIYAERPLIDARSPEEYAGITSATRPRRLAGTRRPGHIPTALNIPWTSATNASGAFKSVTDLDAFYRAAGLDPSAPVIVYSGNGERSAHTWFVLSQLLGYPDVRNYDGSWSEWGSLVRAPIAREGAGSISDPF